MINIKNFPHVGRVAEAVMGVYPFIRRITGSPAAEEVCVNGKKMLQFCSCSYLGLTNNPELKRVAKEAIDTYGVGTTSSGIISGYTDVHAEVEEAIANFMQSEAAIFFNSVTLTSQGIMTTATNPPLASLFPPEMVQQFGLGGGTAIFMDMANHASLYDAVKLARPDELSIYKHLDMNSLEKRMKRSRHKRKLIVTDGYFSMDADLAPLPELIELAQKYGALLMVDDAHGSGVLGENGRGTAEHFGVEDKVDFLIGSFSKGFGVRGGFTIGSETFIKYLRVSARGYLFSATLPASVPAAAIKALEMAAKEPWRRKAVLDNAAYIRNRLKDEGFIVLGNHHIVPWLIGDDHKAEAISNGLEERGILAPAVRYPAAEKGKALIRFMPMAINTRPQLERLVEACIELGKGVAVEV